MTDQEINKAIAEAIGWKWVHLQEQIGLRGVLRGYPPNVECVGVNQEYVTDYCNDLNAMHEAEKVLKGGMRSNYDAELTLICLRDYNFIWESTASQRAEALLRTLNLWR